MTGFVHSFQSLGTVDGPGLRCVVFLQGCPLRCAVCHNPDTWEIGAGEETDTDALVKKILRFKNYFKDKGGATVSGGEPLLQEAFVTELFTKLKALGISTCLDTSGCLIDEHTEALLKVTDLVLLDHKYPTEEGYRKYVGCGRETPERFLELLSDMGIPVWLRRVIVPGLNDDEASVLQLKAIKEAHKNVEKVELLPFRKLCLEKYHSLGIPFPLEDTPEPDRETMSRLEALL